MKQQFTKILLLLFFFTPLALFSQQAAQSQYSFINYKENNFQFFRSAKEFFSPLFEKLRQTIAFDNTQVRVLHIGQGTPDQEVFLRTAYDNIAQMMQGAQSKRGAFWQEVYLVKSYEEKEITLNSSESTQAGGFNRFRVYHSELKDNMDLIIEDLKFYCQSTYFKDRGYTLFETKEPLKNIKLKVVNNSLDNLFIYGFYIEDNNTEFLYDLISRANFSVSQYALDNQLFTQLKNTDVDLIVLSLGEYEASLALYDRDSFIDNMNKFIACLRTAKPKIPIVITTPTDSYYHNKVNENIDYMSQDLLSIAKANNCALWDFYNVMGGKGSSKNWYKKGLMDNRKTTMTQQGYVVSANLYFDAFWGAFEQYLNQRKQEVKPRK
jgi:hypothetical protein